MPPKKIVRKTQQQSRKARSSKGAPSRFSHAFVTPGQKLHQHSAAMVDWARQQLGPIPPVKRQGVLALSDIVGENGATEIEASGAIRFHLTGDTGRVQGQAAEHVSDAMTSDYDLQNPGASPACFIHLGDVIYGTHKDELYRDEFYRPYEHYPGKIIAIPGNHDGEIFTATDPKSLAAFLANFCAGGNPTVADQVRILREQVAQPGVYWWLQAPFVDVIGLYSNIAEGPGFLEGGPANKRDMTQIDWLGATLKAIATERKKKAKRLVIATHHPPYSNGGGHSGSPELLDEVDKACQQAGVWPDLFMSGHAHSYQRHTRAVKEGGSTKKIPYLVVGCGGRGLQHVADAHGQEIAPGVTFDKALQQYGYALLEVSESSLQVRFFAVDENSGKKTLGDSVSI